MSLKQQAVKGVIWSAIESLSRQLVSLVIFFVLARLLNPQAFGLVALASVFTGFVEIFLDQGFSQAIVQRRDLEPQHLDTAFWTNLSISGALTLIGAATAGWVAILLKEPSIAPIVQWLSLSFLLNAFSSVQQALLQRKFAYKALAIRSGAAVIIGGITGVGMAVSGFGAWSLVGQRLANGVAQVAALWWVSDWRPGFNISKRHFQDLFSFGINIVGSNFLNFFNRRSDDLLIGYFLGPVALGYYTIAYRLLLASTSFLTYPFVSVAFSTFSRLQQDAQALRHSFYTFTQTASFFTMPFFLGIAAMAPEVVRVLFGEQWMESVPVLRVLSLIGMLHSITFYNGAMLNSLGKPGWGLKLVLINTIANVVAFAAVVQYGIVAVASAYVIRGYLLLPLGLLLIRKLIHISLLTYIQQLVPSFVSSIVMILALLAVRSSLIDSVSPSLLLLIAIGVGTSLYGATMALIAPKFLRQGMATLRSVVQRSKPKAS